MLVEFHWLLLNATLAIHLYKDGYDMINKVREIQAIGGYNPDCPELAAAGMLAGMRI
jgi:CRISPR/Cas system-associated protein Csm6